MERNEDVVKYAFPFLTGSVIQSFFAEERRHQIGDFKVVRVGEGEMCVAGTALRPASPRLGWSMRYTPKPRRKNNYGNP